MVQLQVMAARRRAVDWHDHRSRAETAASRLFEPVAPVRAYAVAPWERCELVWQIRSAASPGMRLQAALLLQRSAR